MANEQDALDELLAALDDTEALDALLATLAPPDSLDTLLAELEASSATRRPNCQSKAGHLCRCNTTLGVRRR